MAKAFVKSTLIAAALAAGYFVAAPAYASTTWNLEGNFTDTTPTGVGKSLLQGTTTPNTGSSSVIYGNQDSFTSGGQTLQVGAFYYANGTGGGFSGQGANFQAANLEQYSPGLGVTSYTQGSNQEQVGSTPGHTMDNQGGIDAILFKFPSANYAVTNITLSLFGGGDFTYYIGSASALASIQSLASISVSGSTATSTGKAFSILPTTVGATLNGWTDGGTVSTNVSCNSSGTGCVNNGSSSNNTVSEAINAALVQGQYLLIVAALNQTNDDIKIASLTGKTIPEPSTLALFGTAGLIGFYLRRRKRAA